jgi:hypothetical protein
MQVTHHQIRNRIMRTNTKRAQRGQAMTELIAAMAVLLPLILGVIYIGKFSDVKHQAIQASRYAAMSRALDPNRQRSDTVIRNETVARFFRDADKYKEIRRNDQATAPTAGDTNPLWTQVNGEQILNRYSDVNVSLGRSTAADGTLGLLNGPASLLYDNLESRFGVAANVEVPLARITHFAPLNGFDVRIGATTVMAGDPWSAAGADDVADKFTVLSVPGKAVSILNNIPDFIFQLFAGAPTPKFGCVKPDVVPNRVAPLAAYDPTDQSGNNECL